MELGLWLESERMLHANIQNIGVETQREVVRKKSVNVWIISHTVLGWKT